MSNRFKFLIAFALPFLLELALTFPVIAATSTPRSGITGIINLSPSCPGGVRPDRECVIPFANALIQLNKPNGQLVATATSAADGKFEIKVAPGDYELRIVIEGMYPRCESPAVKVKKGVPVEVNISCDSGMR